MCVLGAPSEVCDAQQHDARVDCVVLKSSQRVVKLSSWSPRLRYVCTAFYYITILVQIEYVVCGGSKWVGQRHVGYRRLCGTCVAETLRAVPSHFLSVQSCELFSVCVAAVDEESPRLSPELQQSKQCSLVKRSSEMLYGYCRVPGLR